VEASFVSEEDVFALCEPLFRDLVKRYKGHDVAVPFPRMPYDEAMRRFGVDKPDTRNPLELVDVSGAASDSGFRVFSEAVATGGVVLALRLPAAGALVRKDFDSWEVEAKSLGAKGLAWARFDAQGKASGPLGKVFESGAGGASTLKSAVGVLPGDAALFAAGAVDLCRKVLGHLRKSTAERLGLVQKDRSALLWITEFPLVEWSEEDRRWNACHHPFTSPRESDWPTLEKEPGKVRARAYDLVWDGYEAGGGSIRIHRSDLQNRMFALLGMTPEEVARRFGWFVEALKYGAPPHGGIAFGLDRLVMLLLGEDAIQEVIAFPKTAKATCLLTKAPAPVDASQLEELRISLVPPRS
jgi:aspartyl-tRNA synthetase